MPDAQGNLLPGEPGYVAPGTGLLNATPGQTNVTPGAPIVNYTPAVATPAPTTATGYTPTPYGVAPKATVADQVRTIVGEDSPLMQEAATRARQTMVDRGLLNSSLAVGEGQKAVIQQALPIATADAATYDRAATNTANAENASKGILTQATNTAALQNANAATSVAVSNAGNINVALNAGATAANTTALQKALAVIDTNTKTSLATLDAQNRQLLQTNVNAANMYQETVKNIAAIAVDQNLSKQAKADATATQVNLLNEGLRTTAAVASTQQAAVSALDLSSYFTAAGGLVSGTTAPTPGGLVSGTTAPTPGGLVSGTTAPTPGWLVSGTTAPTPGWLYVGSKGQTYNSSANADASWGPNPYRIPDPRVGFNPKNYTAQPEYDPDTGTVPDPAYHLVAGQGWVHV